MRKYGLAEGVIHKGDREGTQERYKEKAGAYGVLAAVGVERLKKEEG